MNLRVGLQRFRLILRREIMVRLSYRMTLVIAIVSAASGLFSYAFLGNGAVVSATTQTYGMSLGAFLVTGVAFSSIITNGLSMFGDYANPSQLEEVLVTPTDLRIFVLCSSFLTILVSIGTAILLFSMSVLLLGFIFSYNVPLLLAMVFLGVTSAIGLGFVGLGFQLVYKQNYFLSWLLFSFTSLVGNMIVPVQVLPGFLQTVSYVTPQYYFFTGIRVALGSNVAPANFILESFALYSAVLLSFGLLIFQRGLAFIKRNGTHRWI
ncbi:ABC transporter permease [Candidatus Bathyarchaeota archaeon]|nr:MAG: ABC transporter permease [Candidatus Bathyarchaeota archaeon]TMI59115.1 MAG: ABC transporter permease [Candidatus Bathyarchaeota archaeon]